MNSYTAFLSKVEDLYLWEADGTYNATLGFLGGSELRLYDVPLTVYKALQRAYKDKSSGFGD